MEKLLEFNNAKNGLAVYDEEGNEGLIIDCIDIHNIEVQFVPNGKGFYCLDKECEDYDPLYFND